MAVPASVLIPMLGLSAGLLVRDLWEGGWLLLLLRIPVLPSLFEKFVLGGVLTTDQPTQPLIGLAIALGLAIFVFLPVEGRLRRLGRGGVPSTRLPS